MIRLENDKPIDILNYMKIINYFPNVNITYRIILTILELIILNKKNFLRAKTKNNKNLHRLNILSLLSIKR